MSKLAEGTVVRVRKPLKNKVGDVIESVGTLWHVNGTDTHVLLGNGDIWSGTMSEIEHHAPVKVALE